jgi:hypothetical protein
MQIVTLSRHEMNEGGISADVPDINVVLESMWIFSERKEASYNSL